MDLRYQGLQAGLFLQIAKQHLAPIRAQDLIAEVGLPWVKLFPQLLQPLLTGLPRHIIQGVILQPKLTGQQLQHLLLPFFHHLREHTGLSGIIRSLVLNAPHALEAEKAAPLTMTRNKSHAPTRMGRLFRSFLTQSPPFSIL